MPIVNRTSRKDGRNPDAPLAMFPDVFSHMNDDDREISAQSHLGRLSCCQLVSQMKVMRSHNFRYTPLR